VLQIANIIANVEQRCEFLEQRNVVLTKRLLQNQRIFLERNFLNKSKGLLSNVFSDWHRVMRELILEHTLEEANRNLVESQTIAQNLGEVLARDRQAREAATEESEQLSRDLKVLGADSASLQQKAEDSSERLRMLEFQLQAAEQALSGIRMDGAGICGAVDAYERTSRDIKREAINQASEEDAHPVYEGARLVSEADGVMQRLHSVLKQSPKQEKVDAMRSDPGAQQSLAGSPVRSRAATAELSYQVPGLGGPPQPGMVARGVVMPSTMVAPQRVRR
jgi:hypothetical protein